MIQLTDAEFEPWLQTHRPDVISAHGPSIAMLEAAARAGVAVVETLHSPEPLTSDWRDHVRQSPGIATLIAVSDLVRQQYKACDPLYPDESLITIPNGVDQSRRPRVARDRARAWLGLGDEFLFVSLGRYAFQKNTYGLVSAFGDVATLKSDAHLLVAGGVGQVEYAQQVRLLRERLPARGQVHLRDHITNSAAVLAAADAFVLDSFFEGWPLATMEALVAGIPVVTSVVGGVYEQVGDDRIRGYIVPNPLADPDVLSWDAIRDALYVTQANREQLVEALIAVADEREHWASVRPNIAQESAGRFPADAWLRSYAEVLRRAAG